MTADERRRIVAGVSGSSGSLQALRAAVAEARHRGCPLTAVLAWIPPGGERANRHGVPPVLFQAWRDDARCRLRAAFDDALGSVPADLDIRMEVVRGPAGAVLVRTADLPGDLLVVGRGDGGPLHRLLNGSVSRYCTMRAHCPVLVVPSPPLLREARRHLVRERAHGW